MNDDDYEEGGYMTALETAERILACFGVAALLALFAEGWRRMR